jgi:hypothetical protein
MISIEYVAPYRGLQKKLRMASKKMCSTIYAQHHIGAFKKKLRMASKKMRSTM